MISAASLLLWGLLSNWGHHFILGVVKGHVDEICLGGLFDHLLETLLHSNTVLRRSLDVVYAICLSKGQNLISGHLIVQIAFAADQINLTLNIESLDFIEPPGQVDKTFSITQTKAQHDSVGIYIERRVLR